MVDKVQGVQQPDAAAVKQVTGAPRRDVVGPRFDTVLREKLADAAEVKFSAHAMNRLNNRHIELSADEKKMILDGVQKAAEKGAQESLVITDRVALVVSVKNRTVITVASADELDRGVFTNIDSAVICRTGSAVQPAGEARESTT